MTATPRILVVDDDRDMREMLTSLLEQQGLCAQAAGSAHEALERVADDEFDVVLSDVRMPGDDGLQLVRTLRTRQPELPVILMSAFGSREFAAASLHAGAFDYLVKPFKRVAVMMALSRAFEHRQRQRELHPGVPTV